MSNQTNDQPNIQELRDAADRGREAVAEAAAAKRELAMVRAGVDLDTPVGQMFARAYDGQLEVDVVKAAWAEVAPVAGQAPPAPEGPPPGADETELRSGLTSGGANDVPPPPVPEDPVGRGYDEFRDRMQKGESRERASGSVFGSLMQAAASGDERAIWKGWTKEQLGS